MIASVVMAAVLWQLGMAWTPSGGGAVVDLCKDAMARSAIGAVSYVSILLGVWFVAGRPDGPERFAMTSIVRIWTRFQNKKSDKILT
jgi:hypothetical protein